MALADNLFLSRSGHLVSHPGQDRPLTPLEQGETLFRAAQLAEGGNNPFAQPGLTVEQKRAALASLALAFERANAADPRQAGYETADQALQTRASAAPLLLDLAASLDPSRPGERALQGEIVAGYLRLLETEPHGLNRSFMIYDLDRAKGKLPDEVRPEIDRLMREVAPLTPPYEEWFAGGKDKLRVEYYVGDGFWDEELGAYERSGFTRTENPDGTVTLSRQYVHERELNDGTRERLETNVELVMHNGPSGMFSKMSDPDVHAVVYSGHANYGREVPSHLPGAPEQNGAKLFLSLQCGGKGVHNALLERFPDLQVVSSKNSSYGYQEREAWAALLAYAGLPAGIPYGGAMEANHHNSYYSAGAVDTLHHFKESLAASGFAIE